MPEVKKHMTSKIKIARSAKISAFTTSPYSDGLDRKHLYTYYRNVAKCRPVCLSNKRPPGWLSGERVGLMTW